MTTAMMKTEGASSRKGRALPDRTQVPARVRQDPVSAAFGRTRVAFLLLSPFDGHPASAGNGAHVAFAAPSREAIVTAHAAGLDAGATDEGAPGVRAADPMPDVFAAYLRDPWGNKLEMVHGGFSA